MKYLKCIGQTLTALTGVAIFLTLMIGSALMSLGMAYLGFQVVMNLLGM